MPNLNPTGKMLRVHNTEMAKEVVGVRLPIDLDEYVRSLPNRSEWLRKAIAEAYQKDVGTNSGS
ncbi:MAG: hypothetical protein ACRCZS_20810 [Chroococcidiopsis sp.]